MSNADDMTNACCGVAVPARLVPFPTSVSAEACAALKRLVSKGGIPLNALHVMPPPEDHVGWLAIKAAADEQYAAAVKVVAGTVRSAVETIRIGSTTFHMASPDTSSAPQRAYIDFHGGAFVFGGGEGCQVGAQMQADLHGVRCYGVDYRMPPEHPYPAALDDAIATYRHVLEHHAPSEIVVGGRSAGGNLAVAMLLRARDERLPLPAGLILLSPQVDLTESGDSFQVNRLVDVVLPALSWRTIGFMPAGRTGPTPISRRCSAIL